MAVPVTGPHGSPQQTLDCRVRGLAWSPHASSAVKPPPSDFPVGSPGCEENGRAWAARDVEEFPGWSGFDRAVLVAEGDLLGDFAGAAHLVGDHDDRHAAGGEKADRRKPRRAGQGGNAGAARR